MRPMEETVQEFCRWAERKDAVPVSATWLAQILAELIAHALAIEDAMWPDDGPPESADYQAVRNQLPALPFSYYRCAATPLELTELASAKITLGDLYDDLADIYRDLWEGLHFY